MPTKPAASFATARKKLHSQIAAAQKQADTAKKIAKVAKLGFRKAKEKFKEAKRAAKKFRKGVKALKTELAALTVKKPAPRPAAKKKTARRAPVVENPPAEPVVVPVSVEILPATAGETTLQ